VDIGTGASIVRRTYKLRGKWCLLKFPKPVPLTFLLPFSLGYSMIPLAFKVFQEGFGWNLGAKWASAFLGD
jgi:hypothetical protein